MQKKQLTFRVFPIFALTILFSGGCATFDLSKRIPWGAGEDGKPAAPTRLMAVWTDTTMTSPNKPAMRGMGGRIVFYDQANEPVKVKGTLVVYAFDETNRDPTNVTPDRKYVFLTPDFEKHYSKGRLGHSYSFWLPWDQVGGKQAAISLIARFQPDKGGEIIGEQTKHLLPGLTAEVAPPQQWGSAPAAATYQNMPGLMPGLNGAQTPAMLPPGQQALPPQQQQTPSPRTQVPQETAGNGWNNQGVQQASANMPINSAAAADPANGDAGNADSKIKSYTIPLRGAGTSITRPMDQLRAMEQQNPEQARKMLEQQQALFSQQGQPTAAAFQAQQMQLMQQAMANRMAQEAPAPAQPANTTTQEANGMTTTVGNTPLSGRTGSHFQQRQAKPMWGDKPAVSGFQQQGQQPSPEQALQESSAGSPPSRRQALGGTISRLGPSHAR
jgi:hypothetical protein